MQNVFENRTPPFKKGDKIIAKKDYDELKKGDVYEVYKIDSDLITLENGRRYLFHRFVSDVWIDRIKFGLG